MAKVEQQYELSHPTIADERKVAAGKKKEISDLKAWLIVIAGAGAMFAWWEGGSDYVYDYFVSKWINIISTRIGG